MTCTISLLLYSLFSVFKSLKSLKDLYLKRRNFFFHSLLLWRPVGLRVVSHLHLCLYAASSSLAPVVFVRKEGISWSFLQRWAYHLQSPVSGTLNWRLSICWNGFSLVCSFVHLHHAYIAHYCLVNGCQCIYVHHFKCIGICTFLKTFQNHIVSKTSFCICMDLIASY